MTLSRIKLPTVSDAIEEVTILEWHVETGAVVDVGDELVSVQVDKVDLDIPSPVAGTLVEIVAKPDDEISVGGLLCVIESEA